MITPLMVALAPAADFNDSIGVIEMLEDGTLLCRYRLEAESDVPGKKILGEGQFRIVPSDPAYAKTLAFIGPMKPGDHKPMPRIGPNGDVPFKEGGK